MSSAATPLGHGRFHVTGPDGSTIAVAAVEDHRTWVFLRGRVYVIDTAPPARRAASHGHDERDALASPMPATVVAVHVAPGDRVTKGDVLVTLEAMKMELPLRAPRDGVVRSVAVRAGELVQPAVPVLQMD